MAEQHAENTQPVDSLIKALGMLVRHFLKIHSNPKQISVLVGVNQEYGAPLSNP